jgi:uncharacterized protein YjdB
MAEKPPISKKKEKIMKKEIFLIVPFIYRKALLAAGLIALIFCLTFTSCDLPEENEVTGITLNQSSLSIAKGDADYLYVASVTPAGAAYQTVGWKTSDPTLVTVTNGKIVALETSSATLPATATITATVGKASKSCTVTVNAASGTKQVTGVTLAPSPINMTVGGTANLTASITPADAANKEVFYISDKPEIATVGLTSGEVKAVAIGDAKITVTTKNKNKTAICSVTVQPPAAIPVTGVTLDKPTLTLAVGETGDLTATVLPVTATNKTVLWDSNDDSVATVDSDGKVTAVAKGSAIIFATSAEDNGKSAKCIVTVTGDTSSTATVTLNKTALTLLITSLSAGTETLTATITPSETTVTWESSDPAIATVTGSGAGGNVTAVKAGKVTISVKVNGATKAACAVTVIDPATYYGTYTVLYYNSTAKKQLTETIVINSGTYTNQFRISDNEKTGTAEEFFLVDISKWELATTPDSYKSSYPIALKMTGKVSDALPTNTDNLYGSQTAPGFKQDDITNKTDCWVYFYISSDGKKIIRSVFSKGTGAGTTTAVVSLETSSASTTTVRAYTKTP